MTENETRRRALQVSGDIVAEIKKAVIGKDEIIIKTLLAIIAKGHILLDDIPGVGKTTLALAFSRVMSLDYKRMQFTPDVLPADVTGFNIFNKQTSQFEYKEGAAVCSLFLADEINRTSSKTQSALLEIMEEGAVTVDGITRPLPKPYIVIATQNPIGSVGTHSLPESQLDRFIIRLSMGYPDQESEISIMKSKGGVKKEDELRHMVSGGDIISLQNQCNEIYVDDRLYKYISSITAATRSHPDVKLGLSPRGAIALASMTKATALLRGRDFALPEDVRYVLYDVAEHRLLLTSKAKASGADAKSVLKEISAKIPSPKITDG